MQERSRRSYAKARLNVAMKRLLLARSQQEENLARKWVTAWGAAVGEDHFRNFGMSRSARAHAPNQLNRIPI